MAGAPYRHDGAVALLSIHPKYVDLIESGCKRVEFRRSRFARNIAHIVIYATSPYKRLVGFCYVERVVRDTPNRLWDEHGAKGGVPRETLMQYLDQLPVATAIVIRKFHPISERLDLKAIGVKRPPQSFQYLDDDALREVQKCAL